MEMSFEHRIQRFIANSFSVGIVRRMGPAGTLGAGQGFLKDLDLAAISKTLPDRFPHLLDHRTERLRECIGGEKPWGAARKCLNLFFRDALYSHYLRKHYGLAKFERYLEIPLDSYVGKRLKREPEGADLPAWKNVKGLRQN